jgi:hypothetical protein
MSAKAEAGGVMREGEQLLPDAMPKHASHKRSAKFSPEQMAEAIRLRGEQWSWNALALRYGVDNKTVRRYCDPTFTPAGRDEYLGAHEAKEEHRRRQYGDLLFKQRVLAIRRAGASEARHFRLGVCRKSGTRHAKFCPARAAPLTCSPMAEAVE